MKNLKKLISVVLCVAMLASFMVVGTSAATYGDVDESKGYYADVELLSSLDILKGDENGNFNPDAEIKRSEFAAVVCRALGAESAATSKASTFTDVASNHWAVGYIAWAAGKGIVNGYGDGTFMPDKAVTYQEAIKMITAAMGYSKQAETAPYTGFPWGFINLAGEYGITAGIDAAYEAPASRAIVAQLVANALDAPLMNQKDTIYGKINVVYDGNEKSDCDGEERTLLSYYLDVIKVKANVADNYKTDAKLWKKNRDPQVALDNIKFVNVSDKDDYAEDYFTYKSGNLYKANVYEGATAAASYLAYDVYAYIMVNDDDNLELKAIIADGKSVDTLEVTKDIETAEVEADGDVVFTYWEDIENDSKATEVDVAADAVVYVNGTKVDKLNTAKGEAAFENAKNANSVLFIGPRGDDFTKVFITEYQYAIVDYVDVEEETIEFKDGYVTLNKDDRGATFVYTLIKDGEEIELKDLAENDVLSIVAPGGDYEKAEYLDIYVSSKTITGTVTGAKSGKDNHTYYIDKVEYNTVKANALKVGDEGVFYLTSDGKIIDSKATSTLSDNYAYILKAGADESFGDMTYQLKLFTKEGKTVTYNIASSVKVTEEVDGKIVTETLKAADGEQAALYDAIVDLLADSEKESDAQAKAGMRLITYSLSGDEISKISFAADNGEEGSDYTIKSADGSYKASTSKFGGYYFNEATSLFYAPVEKVTRVDKDKKEYEVYAIDADDVALLSFASLDEDQSYTAWAYSVDDRTMGAATIVNSLGFAGKATALAVVKSVSVGLNAENEEATNITVLQGGKTATYAVDEDVKELDKVVEGDIIQIVLNGAGEIAQAQVVYTAGKLTAYADEVNKDDSDIEFAAGYVVNGGNGEIYLNSELKEAGAADYGFNYEAGCTLAMVDGDKANTSSFVRALTSTSAVKYIKSFDDKGAPRGDIYYAVVRLVDDEIVDVVEYVNFDLK